MTKNVDRQTEGCTDKRGDSNIPKPLKVCLWGYKK